MSKSPSASTVSRRTALGMLGAAGAAWSIGCNGDTPTTPTTITSTPTTPTTTNPPAGTTESCVVSAQETIGPYPSLADFIRSDIRENRAGLPLALNITVVSVNNACAPVGSALVDIWQCDSDGEYSQYGSARTQTFLRGIQPTDGSGRVTFITIYPGWYQGRATHIHLEVTLNGRSLKVTQLAFPEDVTAAVYRTGVYASRGQNPTANARDMVFSDGVSTELVTLVGDTTGGYIGTIQVGVQV
jgi:protocatechuate 3,4-dioxygenase beta subunit